MARTRHADVVQPVDPRRVSGQWRHYRIDRLKFIYCLRGTILTTRKMHRRIYCPLLVAKMEDQLL